MKFNMYVFGCQFVFRVDRNTHYKSKRARRKTNKYWAKFDNVTRLEAREWREFDASQQQWS
jgi:hypothetical protein